MPLQGHVKPVSLIDALWRETAGPSPSRAAIYVEPGGDVWTFRDLEDRVADRARDLTGGRIVPTRAGNTPEFVIEFLAARRAGKVFVPFDPSSGETARHMALQSFESHLPPENTAMIKMTSGSTAQPRGIALSESQLVDGARNIIESMAITPEDVHLGAISLAHSYGFDNLVLPLILMGSPIVLMESFYPAAAVRAIARRRVSFVPLVPVMYDALASQEGDWSSVRTCISAGTPLPPEVGTAFASRTGRKVQTFYGSSECGGITFDATRSGDLPRGCVGTPLAGVTVDLTEKGLVRVRSRAVALGYIPHEEGGALRDGAFISGDLGRLDESGRLILTGRSADVINVAGKKVAPAEIESCLLALEGVTSAAVVGIPDARRGEYVGALAVVAPGLTEGHVLAHCRSRLDAWKVPKRLRLVDRLPIDERGKLSKEKVRGLLLTS